METTVVKTVALAVTVNAMRSVVPGVLPLASLTIGAGLVLRALPTGTVEAVLLALVLSLTGLGNYFPFNFMVWFAGGAGFFMCTYECTVHVERLQRQRRARRNKQAKQALEQDTTVEQDKSEQKEPIGLIVLVIGTLLYSVLGALPGGALLG